MSHLPDLNEPDADPHVWLEEIEGEKAMAWAAEQREQTAKALAHPTIERDAKDLRKALDNPTRIPQVSRLGGKLYNFWKDEKNKKGIWRRINLDQYAKDEGWETVLDLDAIAEKENEDWVWHGAETFAGAPELAMLSLSRGGKDASVIREYNIEEKGFVKASPFELDEAKSSVVWVDRDTLLVTSALGGPEYETTSGYYTHARVWKRGTPLTSAKKVFEVPRESVAVNVSVDYRTNRILYSDMIDFFNYRRSLGDISGPKTSLDLPTDVSMKFAGDDLLVRTRKPWTLDKKYEADTVLVFSLDEFLAGTRNPTVLFTSTPRTTVESMDLANGRVYLHILDDLRPRVQVWSRKEKWSSEEIHGLPQSGLVRMSMLDSEEEESDGSMVIISEDPLTPPTLSIWSVGETEAKKYRQSAAIFDTKGLRVTRYDATASDGEKIPYFVTGPYDTSGNAPVYLTGYGGFKISSGLPRYDPNMGVVWLARGGTTVVTALRGGGEFGSPWHEAGKGPRKIVAQDDFAAVAEDLVKRGITNVPRIAAVGASNGGLLIANMWTRHPDKFGALSCLIPLVDMRRYNKLLAGASWVGEFGNPDKPEEWEYLSKISAYHLFTNADGHPPIFVATTRKDDRVHPGHARKFAAKLIECGANVMYHEPLAGGHGYGADNEQVSEFIALNVRFMRKAIGWEV